MSLTNWRKTLNRQRKLLLHFVWVYSSGKKLWEAWKGAWRAWLQAKFGTSVVEKKSTENSNKTEVENCRNGKRKRYMVRSDLDRVNYPSAIAKYIMKFFDEMFHYAQLYIAETCKTDAWTIYMTVEWSPNLCSEDISMIRDWRRQCLKMTISIGEHISNEKMITLILEEVIFFKLSKTKMEINLLEKSFFHFVPWKNQKMAPYSQARQELQWTL